MGLLYFLLQESVCEGIDWTFFFK